jgi:hypothetical protein
MSIQVKMPGLLSSLNDRLGCVAGNPDAAVAAWGEKIAP